MVMLFILDQEYMGVELGDLLHGRQWGADNALSNLQVECFVCSFGVVFFLLVISALWYVHS
jgi:hypothetical protein